MEKLRKNLVIPEAMIPNNRMFEIIGEKGKTYLLQNDAMFTGLQHSKGEFSNFFIKIRDDNRLFGKKCVSCKQSIIPPFMERCPKPGCNFAQMVDERILDVGIMAASPVITMFPPSRFKSEVPFANGYVFLMTKYGKYTDTAIKLRARTTTGSMRPAIFKKNMFVKVVFSNVCVGEILDIFVVPQNELKEEEIDKSPLFENELEWKNNSFSFNPMTKTEVDKTSDLHEELYNFSNLIDKSPRSQKDLAEWERIVSIVTAGGTEYFKISEGKFEVGRFVNPDFEITVTDTDNLLIWFKSLTNADLICPPLTDLVMEGKLILNKSEIETIVRLDRISRSLRRDEVINYK